MPHAWLITGPKGVGKATLAFRMARALLDARGDAERPGLLGEAPSAIATLDVDPAPLAAAFGNVHARSIGRWRAELTPDQLADVEAEAGQLLAQLGYS